MNWLDWLLLALLVAAAVRGFFRGFVVEIASLFALVVGIWAASRYNARVAGWIGMDAQHEVVSFLVTFVGVLMAVHLLARVITKVMDLAQLGLPNKVAGGLFGLLRAAFVLSVALNILLARAEVTGLVSRDTLEASVLYRPLRAVAPAMVPALGNAQWLQDAVKALQRGAEQV
ncbi:MAG TPA: CvpA family protein [Flavobacteriales bacterium]|nr:CvpA family protein [Flavobacteriales bacterium]